MQWRRRPFQQPGRSCRPCPAAGSQLLADEEAATPAATMQWCRLIPWHRTGGRDTTTPTVIEIGALRPQHTTASRRSRPHGSMDSVLKDTDASAPRRMRGPGGRDEHASIGHLHLEGHEETECRPKSRQPPSQR
ncbi:hypothetical protein EJB05_35962, partial [Eragrostis curvula]